jgi:hypothetical protein
MPDGLTDRPADVWEALLAIGDAAGGEWPDRARKAAVKINEERQQADSSLGVRLLADIRTAFGDAGRLTSAALVEKLVAMEEAPWGELGRTHKPLDARGLAGRVKDYGVRPQTIRIGPNAADTAKGYERAWFLDAWNRYLLHPAEEPSQPSQPSPGTQNDVTDERGVTDRSVTDSRPSQESVLDVPLVTAVTASSGGEEEPRFCPDHPDAQLNRDGYCFEGWHRVQEERS